MRVTPIGKARRILAALAAACHLLVFSAAPLLHTCDRAPLPERSAASLAGPLGTLCACPTPGQSCPCRLIGSGRTTSRVAMPATHRDGGVPAVTAAGDLEAGGECLACRYLSGNQSGSPLDAAPVCGPVDSGEPCTVIAAGIPIQPALFDQPARAPPTAS